MRPEFPHNFAPWGLHAGVKEEFEEEANCTCEMLRLGEECGNTALNILISDRPMGGYYVIAVCEWCWHEIGMTGEETTAYWREKQREWRVR